MRRAVALTRRAGGTILGKTVTAEFATFVRGETRNPHDLSRTPGGSSSGSAAAVADFMVPLAFGTQTAGSLIRPGSYCGIVAYKPTYNILAARRRQAGRRLARHGGRVWAERRGRRLFRRRPDRIARTWKEPWSVRRDRRCAAPTNGSACSRRCGRLRARTARAQRARVRAARARSKACARAIPPSSGTKCARSLADEFARFPGQARSGAAQALRGRLRDRRREYARAQQHAARMPRACLPKPSATTMCCSRPPRPARRPRALPPPATSR